jgi:hypothetical protein
LGQLAVVGLVAILALAACQKPAFLEAELPNDGPPIAVSQEAARRFVEKVTVAGQSAAETKSLSFTVSQEEVTSFLNIGGLLAEQVQALDLENLEDLQQLESAQGLEGLEGLQEWQTLLAAREGLPNIRLSDLSLRVVLREPEVYFKSNGHIVIRGYAEAVGQRQPLRLVLAPRASEGELAFDFVEGNLGPVSVPELLVDQVGKGLARAILTGQEYAEVTQVHVGDGSLTLSGRYRG